MPGCIFIKKTYIKTGLDTINTVTPKVVRKKPIQYSNKRHGVKKLKVKATERHTVDQDSSPDPG